MSGKKRITIDSSNYHWLQEQAEQLRSIRADLPERIESNLRRNAAELQDRLAPLEQRQRDFITAIDSLDTELRESEIRAAKRLEQQQQSMRRSLAEMDERHVRDIGQVRQELHDSEEQLYEELAATELRLRQENLRLLAEQDDQLRRLIADERHTRQKQVNILQNEIDTLTSNLHANEQRKMALALSWITDAQTVLDFVSSHYQCEQFSPGQLAKLERELLQARQNLASHTPEASLAAAQGAYNGLSDLRLELERLEREWQFWRSQALASTRALLAEAARNRQVNGLDIQGQVIDLEIEVDWWTDGNLTTLQKDIEKEVSQLEGSNLTTDALRKIVEEATPSLRQRLADVVEQARLAVVSSQLRYSIADLVVQALEEQGFDVEDGVYQGKDMRNGYFAKVLHPDGAEVVVSVRVDTRQPGQNVVEINSYDEGMVSDAELRQRAEEINRSLRCRNENLQISTPQRTGEPPNPEVRDLKKVAQSQLHQRM